MASLTVMEHPQITFEIITDSVLLTLLQISTSQNSETMASLTVMEHPQNTFEIITDRVVDGQDFCDFLDTNGDAYNALMGREEIMLMASLRNPSVFSSMVTQAIQCGVGSMADTLSSLGTSITELAGSVMNRIRGWWSYS